jgi:hypothetical protein
VRLCAFIIALTPTWLSARELAACSEQQKQVHAAVLTKFSVRNFPRLVNMAECDLFAPTSTQRGELAFGPNYEWQLPFTYYPANAEASTPAPLLFVFPGISGESVLDRHVARYFSRHGYSVVISHLFDAEDSDSLPILAQKLIKSMYANFAIVDYFSSLEGIDKEKLFSLGTSFGGVRAVYHSLLDERVKASVLLVAGPLPDVMTFSRMGGMPERRQLHMADEGISSLQQYRDTVEKMFKLKVEDWACRRKSSDFFMYISDRDSWVPTSSQWELHQILGEPQMRRSSLGHIKSSVWNLLWHKKEMRRFFEEHV